MELQFEDNEYYLVDENNDTIATTDRILIKEDGYMKKLSIKNCEAIERGYDVFELAYDSSKEFLIESTHSPSFTFGYELGFQKALEILGDKKFSEEDVISMIEKSRETGLTAQFLILTKQPIEIDVEVVMSEIVTDDFVGMQGIPKLDTNGCLILRKI